MIVREEIKINDKPFYKTYSDKGKMIQKEGTEEKYAEAIDVILYKYIETEEDIDDRSKL